MLQKVVWTEGMFLTPQHFQQQERYLEHFCSMLHGFDGNACGFGELRIDPHLARQAKVGLLHASGILPDMTPFDMPHAHALPEPVDINPDMRNVMVFLVLPLQRHGVTEISNTLTGGTRYRSAEIDIIDTATDGGGEYRIDICSAQFRLIAASEPPPGCACLPIARIVEVRDDKSLQLDENFVPPCIDINVSDRLRGFIAELAGMLQHRASALAARTSDGNKPGTAEFTDYLMLLAVNRYLPIIAQQGMHYRWHPRDCHLILLQLAGELATFSSRKRSPMQFPIYQHHRLHETFAPLISSLRQSLSAVIEQTALALPFTLHNYGIRIATITDRGLLETAQFVLAVKADMPAERICERFIGVAKLAAVEQIRQLVNRQLPGIRLSTLPVAPRQIPWHSGFSYFAVERNCELWSSLRSSAGFALHVGEGFPGIELEFWAIRE